MIGLGTVFAMAGTSPTPEVQRPFPADLAGIVAARVEVRVTELLDDETARWGLGRPGPAAPARRPARPGHGRWQAPAAGVLPLGLRGRRRRAPDDQRIIDAGAAFELLQAFALIHDDVMDGRGQPSGQRHHAHSRFAQHHHDAEAGPGESRRFGEGVAILVGDVALVYSDLLLPSGSPELAALWHELRVELNIGQYLDLSGTATGGVDRAGARQIARLKSGRYTIERPLQLGATLAGRPDLVAPLSGYGDPLGEAFQLRDDVLGAFGLDAARTGKPVGDDLREGKPTLLLAVARERAPTRSPSATCWPRWATPTSPTRLIADLQALFVATGALDVVEAEITRAGRPGRRAALAHADRPSGTSPRREHAELALRDLAAFVVARDAGVRADRQAAW